MKSIGAHILRIGLGLTFIWMGILILENPSGFGSIINSWASSLLIFPLSTTMLIVAIFDIVIGALLVVGFLTRLVSLLAFLHLLSIIIVAFDNNAIIARDFGLMAATLAIFLKT